MPELLLLQDRVANVIALGESHFREFKSAFEGRPDSKKPRNVARICADIGEALVAFANADGGELLVGVEDDGEVTGISHTEQQILEMLNASNTHVHSESRLPIIQATKLNIQDKLVLYFAVSKGTTEVYQLPDGRCMRRQDKSTVPAVMQRILFERQEVRSREYDRVFEDGAAVTDLSFTLLTTLANEYLQGLSVERYLQQIGLAEFSPGGLRLRRAALLLFSNDVLRWHPRSQVRILKITGTELLPGESYNVLTDEHVTGNIFELLTASWEKLRPFLAYKTEFGSDAKFEQRYVYPEAACREALINAIAHRDYTIQTGIDVFIFDDRMEFRSPGSLLSTISIQDLEDLRGVHESRNALIAKVLRENRFMRELGEGMKRIFELMQKNELGMPQLTATSNSFSVTLKNQSVFSAQQRAWLDMFADYGLSTLQKRIVVFGMNGRRISRSDIYSAMSTDDRDTYDREVTGLRNLNILKEIRTNPEAARIARQERINKARVHRFEVQLPKDIQRSSVIPNSVDKFHSDSVSRNDRMVYVGNLSYQTSREELADALSKYGRITRIDLPPGNSVDLNKGFGFVHYETEEAAAGALNEAEFIVLRGRILKIERYSKS